MEGTPAHARPARRAHPFHPVGRGKRKDQEFDNPKKREISASSEEGKRMQYLVSEQGYYRKRRGTYNKKRGKIPKKGAPIRKAVL